MTNGSHTMIQVLNTFKMIHYKQSICIGRSLVLHACFNFLSTTANTACPVRNLIRNAHSVIYPVFKRRALSTIKIPSIHCTSSFLTITHYLTTMAPTIMIHLDYWTITNNSMSMSAYLWMSCCSPLVVIAPTWVT